MNCVIDALSVFVTSPTSLLCATDWIATEAISGANFFWPLAQTNSADLLSSSIAVIGDAGQATLDAGHAAADHHEEAIRIRVGK